MAKSSDPVTPQFRTALLRKLKNMFPSCSAQISMVGRGVEFELTDQTGAKRSGIVQIYRGRADLLTDSSLWALIWHAGAPPAGFPREF